MEDHKITTAALLSAIITIAIRAILDACTESTRHKRELRKLVFQRKTDAVEKAMSWYQEAIDCYMMMQLACNEIDEKYNPATCAKFLTAANQSSKLSRETRLRLNQIYLYYNFTDIEKRHNVIESAQCINCAFAEISKNDVKETELRLAGATDDSSKIKELQVKTISLFKELSKALEDQISSIAEIQSVIRQEYKSYSE